MNLSIKCYELWDSSKTEKSSLVKKAMKKTRTKNKRERSIGVMV
jgi:hypothetical protein